MTFLTAKQRLLRFLLLGIAPVAISSAAHGQNAQTTIYKIPEAGIQMDLPAGWEASNDRNGTHGMVKKDGDGYVALSMVVLPREPSMTIDVLYAAFSEGIFENAKKDWKGVKAGEIMKDTQNGMAVRAQKFDGTDADKGVEVEGLVIVFDAPKPVGIFGRRTKKLSDALAKETSDILISIKKIAQSTIYKIPEAGIQLDLPAGWEASKDRDGHLIGKKDGDDYVVLSMSVIPREPSMTIDVVYALFSEGVFKATKKDWKGFKAGEIMKDTQNGMAVRAQKFDGTFADQGGELEGLVIVFDAPKPLGVFAQRTKKLSDALAKESSDILSSIKKI